MKPEAKLTLLFIVLFLCTAAVVPSWKEDARRLTPEELAEAGIMVQAPDADK